MHLDQAAWQTSGCIEKQRSSSLARCMVERSCSNRAMSAAHLKEHIARKQLCQDAAEGPDVHFLAI